MTLIEEAIASKSLVRWGHPSWSLPATYFMTEDHRVFCRCLKLSGPLETWHWFEPRKYGRNRPVQIKSVEHFHTLWESACSTLSGTS